MWGLTQREVLGPRNVRPITFFDTVAAIEDEALGIGLPADVPDIVGYVDLLLTSGFPGACQILRPHAWPDPCSDWSAVRSSETRTSLVE